MASLSPGQIQNIRWETSGQFKIEGNKSESSNRVNYNCSWLCCLSDCSMFYRVQSSLSVLSPERRYQDDSVPAFNGYLADVFLVKSSLPGIAVETQVVKSNFRGITKLYFKMHEIEH